MRGKKIVTDVVANAPGAETSTKVAKADDIKIKEEIIISIT